MPIVEILEMLLCLMAGPVVCAESRWDEISELKQVRTIKDRAIGKDELKAEKD